MVKGEEGSREYSVDGTAIITTAKHVLGSGANNTLGRQYDIGRRDIHETVFDENVVDDSAFGDGKSRTALKEIRQVVFTVSEKMKKKKADTELLERRFSCPGSPQKNVGTAVARDKSDQKKKKKKVDTELLENRISLPGSRQKNVGTAVTQDKSEEKKKKKVDTELLENRISLPGSRQKNVGTAVNQDKSHQKKKKKKRKKDDTELLENRISLRGSLQKNVGAAITRDKSHQKNKKKDDTELLEKKLKEITFIEDEKVQLEKNPWAALKTEEQKENSDGKFYLQAEMCMKDNLEMEHRPDNKVEIPKVDRELYKIACTVATLTLRTMCGLDYVVWNNVEEKVLRNSNISEGFRTRVFKSIAMFVLSIYDVEDFVRFYDRSTLTGQCKSLYRELPILESKHGSLNIIAERRIELEKYSLLTEREFASLILCHFNAVKMTLGDGERRLPCPILGTPLDPPEIRSSIVPELAKITPKSVGYNDVSVVMTVMEKYKPLKEDIKIHLIREIGEGRCSCILLRLILEAFIGMDFLALDKQSHSLEQHSFLDEVAMIMWFSLAGLDRMRKFAVEQSLSFATGPLRYGLFGQFTDEAIELIEYADSHRRCQGHRYVGVRHILWALSLTTISSSVERIINDTGLKSLYEEPAQYPVYDIYLSSGNLASCRGDEKVGVEHLVIAILFRRSPRRGENKVKKKKKQKQKQKKQALDKDLSLASDGEMWCAVLRNKSVQMFLNEIAGVKVIIESKDITTSRGTDVSHFDMMLNRDMRSVLGAMEQLERDLRTGSCSFPPIREEHCPWSLRCQTYARNF